MGFGFYPVGRGDTAEIDRLAKEGKQTDDAANSFEALATWQQGLELNAGRHR